MPGFSEINEIVFPDKGNEAYSHKPSKLIVKFRQIPHESY